MKKTRQHTTTTRKRNNDHMLSVRVPGNLVSVLKGFGINISEVVNEAIRNKVLDEIGKSRKK